jgi:hypothetical protein
MVLSTFEEGNKSATVCIQGREYVVQHYINNQFIHASIFNKEQAAEIEAENWVLGH